MLRARHALDILNNVLRVEPNNPGVMHYIIHASDNPKMATLGLAAARRYAQIAPASAHALHMPGHIFARLGLWDEDIRANLRSKAAAERRSIRRIGAENRLHAMEFLQYAYLQIGRDDLAKVIMSEAATIQLVELSPDFDAYYHWVEASFPARFALETNDWAGALALMPTANATTSAQRVTFWANAVAAGHLGDQKAAEQAVEKYRATLTALESASTDMARQTEWVETQTWAVFARGDAEHAIALLRPVADHQDKIGKREVEVPAREMLGDMFRLEGRHHEALREYRLSLQIDPARFNTLLHAGEVAEAMGLGQEAATYYRLLLRNVAHASELSQQALAKPRAFLRAFDHGAKPERRPHGRTN